MDVEKGGGRRGVRLTEGGDAQATIAATSVEKEHAETQLAFSKATNFDDVAPKEKHVQVLLHKCGQHGDGQSRAFVLEAIAKQIASAKPWRTMLKTHVVLHRLLRECEGGEFKHEFFRFLEFLSRKTHAPKDQTLFNIRYWKDDANSNATELTGWTRAYAAYLEELCALNAHVPSIVGRSDANGRGVVNPLKDCDYATLMHVMPLLQTLVRRITDCEPRSAAVRENAVSSFAAGLVAMDSLMIYRVMNEAVINLVDKYFDTNKVDAGKGLTIFKKFLSQIEDLQRVYDACASIGALENGSKFSKLEAPPATFVKSMEEYFESAPREGLPLRERRLAGAKASTGASTSAALTVNLPSSNSGPDLIAAAPGPAALSPSGNVIDALSQLELGAPSAQANDPFSAIPAPPPAPVAPASSNALDLFAGPSGSLSAPASSMSLSNPFGGAPVVAPPAYGAPTQAQSNTSSPKGTNPFGDNPFGSPVHKQIDRNTLDKMYASSPPPSPKGNAGMSNMAAPYINPAFMAPQQPYANSSPQQLALPAPGARFPQQGVPQYAMPPQQQYGSPQYGAPQYGAPQYGAPQQYRQYPPQPHGVPPPRQEPPLHPAFRSPNPPAAGSSAGQSPTTSSGSLI